MKTTGTVITDRAGRYGKQLANHMGRKIDTTWTADGGAHGLGAGTLTFGDGSAVELLATPTQLVAEATVTSDESDQVAAIEHAVGKHVVKFGLREGLTCTWVREDGSAGTSQDASLFDED